MGTAALTGGGTLQGAGYKIAGNVLVTGKEIYDYWDRWAYQGNPGWTNKVGVSIQPGRASDVYPRGARSNAADGYATTERNEDANPYNHFSRIVNMTSPGSTSGYWASPAVRMQPDGRCYVVKFRSSLLQLFRLTTGGLGIDYFNSADYLYFQGWNYYNQFDVMELEARGYNIICRINNVQAFNYYDSDIAGRLTGGKAGVMISRIHFNPPQLKDTKIWWSESLVLSGNGEMKAFGKKFKHRRTIE